MELSYTRYELIPLIQLNRVHGDTPRQGIIIRGETDEGVGYFEYFPWEHFGDCTTELFIEEMKRTSSQLKQKVKKCIEEVIYFLKETPDVQLYNHQLISPHTPVEEIKS